MAPVIASTGTASLTALLNAMAADHPILDRKKQGGWEEFERKWTEKLDMVKGLVNNGGPLPDTLLFESLKLCLDDADKVMMQRMKEENNTLHFAKFFSHLRQKYACDPTVQNRRSWESLKLECTGNLPTLAQWSLFKEKFQLLRNRVEDRLEGEEYRLLMDKLPFQWKKNIVMEENKRKKDKWVLKMSNLPPRTPLQLQHEIEDVVGQRIPNIQEVHGGMLVTCGNSDVAQVVLGLAGRVLGDKTVRVSKVDKNMTGDAILTFLTERLEAEERVKTFGHGTGGGSSSLGAFSWSVSEVRDEEREGDTEVCQVGGKGGGRGRSSSPKVHDKGQDKGRDKGNGRNNRYRGTGRQEGCPEGERHREGSGVTPVPVQGWGEGPPVGPPSSFTSYQGPTAPLPSFSGDFPQGGQTFQRGYTMPTPPPVYQPPMSHAPTSPHFQGGHGAPYQGFSYGKGTGTGQGMGRGGGNSGRGQGPPGWYCSTCRVYHPPEHVPRPVNRRDPPPPPGAGWSSGTPASPLGGVSGSGKGGPRFAPGAPHSSK